MSADCFRTELRKILVSSQWFQTLLLLFGTVLLPILNAVLINLYTAGNCRGSGYSLLVGVVFQVGVAAILVVREHQMRDPAAVLLEAEDKCRELAASEQELARRKEAYRMVRSAFDALNQQSCHLQTTACSFADGLRPIIGKITASMWTALGCTSNRYTIEAYFDVWHESESDGSLLKLPGGYGLMFFASPAFTSQQVVELGNHHPVVLMNWRAGTAPDTVDIANFPGQYFSDGKRIPSLYFNRCAVVSIPAQCESDSLGLLVLTADQEAPLASNVLDTLGFVATIISVYFTKHEDCQRERALRIQMERMQLERPSRSPESGDLTIDRATYGSGDTRKDVTDIVRVLVRQHPPFFSVENENLGGDPLESVLKELTIEYSYGDKRCKKIIREHEFIRLP